MAEDREVKTEYIVTDLLIGEAALRAAALYEDGRLSQLEVRRKDDDSRVGEIVLGVVDTVERSLGGAFVRIGHTTRALLPLKDGKMTGSSKRPVMITKDEQGIKQAVVTDRLSVTGRYTVVAENSEEKGRLSFSSKLTRSEKEKLKAGIEEVPDGFDILLRTNARKAVAEEIQKEITGAVTALKEIRGKGTQGKAFTVLMRPPEFYVSLLRDFPFAPDKVLSDIPLAAERLKEICPCASLYEERGMTLAERYDLKNAIEKLTQKVSWLKSGAYLVIEPTEALTVIDVNSGHSKKGRSAQETYRNVNFEAVEEAARQIRLRDLSGIILIDLIKMKNEEDFEEVLKFAKEVLKRDRRHAEALDITKAGLLEIVRQKTARPLAETVWSRRESRT